MANKKIKYIVITILLGMTSAVVNEIQYDSFHDVTTGILQLERIPMQIGKWQGKDLNLDEKVYKILETRAIIHRNYTDENGNTILLSIVHYSDTKVDFHVPEACLGGLGERTNKSLKLLRLKIHDKPVLLESAEIIASGSRGKTLSLYFYKTGTYMGQNYVKMRLDLAKNSILNKDKSGSLVRITHSLIDTIEEKKVLFLMTDFIQNIIIFI